MVGGVRGEERRAVRSEEWSPLRGGGCEAQ